jgi:DnaK suppressor protein
MTVRSTKARSSMNSDALQQNLQQVLHERRREMRAALQARLHRTPFSDGAVSGLDDSEHVEAGVQDDIEAALIQIKGRAIRQVEASMARLEAGHYGRCADCQKKIPEVRLRALPFALRCRACEESHEGGLSV